MATALRVSPGMTVGRVIAAPDLSALQADAQMQPLASGRKALLAAFNRLRQPRDPNAVEVDAGRHLATKPRRSATIEP